MSSKVTWCMEGTYREGEEEWKVELEKRLSFSEADLSRY